MKTIDEMIAVMTAYNEGKKIECKCKRLDRDDSCADNVIISLAKVMLDPTISCETKTELARIILTKAMGE